MKGFQIMESRIEEEEKDTIEDQLNIMQNQNAPKKRQKLKHSEIQNSSGINLSSESATVQKEEIFTYVNKQNNALPSDILHNSINELDRDEFILKQKSQKLFDYAGSIQDLELKCPICIEFVIACRMPKCGHIICDQCLNEWLLRKKECPVCRENIISHDIKEQPFLDHVIKATLQSQEKKEISDHMGRKFSLCDQEVKGSLLDDVKDFFCDPQFSGAGSRETEEKKKDIIEKGNRIRRALSESLQQESEYSRWLKRWSNYNDWKKKHNLDYSSIHVGQALDVRDTENIWCTGVVEMLLTFKNSPPIVYIHYDGWAKKYDEYLPVTSTRLAGLGVYTERVDIPRYEMQNGIQMNHSRIINAGADEASYLGQSQNPNNPEREETQNQESQNDVPERPLNRVRSTINLRTGQTITELADEDDISDEENGLNEGRLDDQDIFQGQIHEGGVHHHFEHDGEPLSEDQDFQSIEELIIEAGGGDEEEKESANNLNELIQQIASSGQYVISPSRDSQRESHREAHIGRDTELPQESEGPEPVTTQVVAESVGGSGEEGREEQEGGAEQEVSSL